MSKNSLAPSGRGLRPQAVGERASRRHEGFGQRRGSLPPALRATAPPLAQAPPPPYRGSLSPRGRFFDTQGFLLGGSCPRSGLMRGRSALLTVFGFLRAVRPSSGPAGPPFPSGEGFKFQIALNPLPTISLLLTMVINAWSSRPRTYRRSFCAWPRVNTVVSTHFSSWV